MNTRTTYTALRRAYRALALPEPCPRAVAPSTRLLRAFTRACAQVLIPAHPRARAGRNDNAPPVIAHGGDVGDVSGVHSAETLRGVT